MGLVEIRRSRVAGHGAQRFCVERRRFQIDALVLLRPPHALLTLTMYYPHSLHYLAQLRRRRKHHGFRTPGRKTEPSEGELKRDLDKAWGGHEEAFDGWEIRS